MRGAASGAQGAKCNALGKAPQWQSHAIVQHARQRWRHGLPSTSAHSVAIAIVNRIASTRHSLIPREVE
jgi:hypothetical protein